MKENIIREVVDAVRDTAIEFHEHQSLRERLAYAMGPLIDYCKGNGTPAAPVVAEGLRDALQGCVTLLEKIDTLRHIAPEFDVLDKARAALAAHPVAGSPAEPKGPTQAMFLAAEKAGVSFATQQKCWAAWFGEPMPASEAAKQTLPPSECNAALRAAPAGHLYAGVSMFSDEDIDDMYRHHALTEASNAELDFAREIESLVAARFRAEGGITNGSNANLAAPAAPTDAKAALGLVDALNTMMWLYRRLPRGYGRVPHVDRTVTALAKVTGTDVDEYLAERDGAQSVRDAAQPNVLIESGALRQYRHNDGSDGFVFAYDKEITDRVLAAQPIAPGKDKP